MLHVDLFALHLDHPRVLEHPPRRGTSGRFLFEAANGKSAVVLSSHGGGGGVAREIERGIRYSPALDKILESLAPLDAVIWFVFELGNRLPDNVRQEVD